MASWQSTQFFLCLRVLLRSSNGFRCVLVSYCCYNKLPWTWWVKTTHLSYSSRGQKSWNQDISRLCSFSYEKALRENSFPCLFQLLETTCILWVVNPSSIFKYFSPTHLSLFASIIPSPVTLLLLSILRTRDSFLISRPSVRSHLQNFCHVRTQVLGIRTWTLVVRGCHYSAYQGDNSLKPPLYNFPLIFLFWPHWWLLC